MTHTEKLADFVQAAGEVADLKAQRCRMLAQRLRVMHNTRVRNGGLTDHQKAELVNLEREATRELDRIS